MKTKRDFLRRSLQTLQILLLICISTSFASALASNANWAPGTPLELAKLRARQIQQLEYDLEFKIPNAVSEPVLGAENIRIALKKTGEPIVLDFKAEASAKIAKLEINGHDSEINWRDGHIVVGPQWLKKGQNSVSVEFTSGDSGFQRREDFLYTLFVPDKASSAFPCFDQPDLKGVLKLSLQMPIGWTSVSQGSAVLQVTTADTTRVEFKAGLPTSPYLFAFAAGKFEKVTRTVNGRSMTLYHRETDKDKVANNLDAIFDLHGKSLAWLETYTSIKFPFEKFDFVALPSFPFGGMEHPGSIFYIDKVLFLNPSATQAQQLARAHTIAHETSHMWFGDMVTMKWFNDVWLKEVFANFMADKIVDPLFPNINHDVDFLLNHYPRAYAVDRSRGTHPIQQKLDNLNEASSLYGSIIYHKAPIVLRQLETLVGAGVFKMGVRSYLKKFAFKNAEWMDLLNAIENESKQPLKAWNQIWIQEAGRPELEVSVESSPKTMSCTGVATDPDNKNRLWPQSLELAFGDACPKQTLRFSAISARTSESFKTHCKPQYILTTAQNPGYSQFKLNDQTIDFLIHRLEKIDDENIRSVAWLDLWENVLTRRISAAAFTELASRALVSEPTEVITDYVLGQLQGAYWSLLTNAERVRLAPDLETMFWKQVQNKSLTVPLRSAYFRAYQTVFLSDRAWENLHDVWSGRNKMPEFGFTESDYMGMTYSLMLRRPLRTSELFKKQDARLKDPERKKEFAFVSQALSKSQAERDAFFKSLLKAENRKNENWTEDALSFLNHPLLGTESEKYLEASLNLLPEIRATSGIFFPLGWLQSSLDYHVDQAARDIVDRYLDQHADLDPGLRLKLLQASDEIMRFTKPKNAGAKTSS